MAAIRTIQRTTRRALFAAGVVVATFSVAVAKLPAPPPMDDKAKAVAEEKKAKDAASAEAVKAQQTRAEDRVATRYIAEQKAKGKAVTAQMGPAAMVAASSAKAPATAAKQTPAAPPPKN